MELAVALVVFLLEVVARALLFVVAWHLIVLVDPRGARLVVQRMLRLIEKRERERNR